MVPPRAPSRLPRPEALPVQFRQFPQHALQFLPGGHALAHGLGQGLRHVIAGGAVGSAKAHVEMRTVLVPLMATAAGPTAGAIGLRQGCAPQKASSERPAPAFHAAIFSSLYSWCRPAR